MYKDVIGTRMKDFYESIPNIRLTRRIPVAVRIDGKSFHTFTKHFAKPFDEILMTVMQNTMLKLCENISGCVFGYTQSDEITLILTDYKTLETDAWFQYKVQKLCSIIASMTTLYFNQNFASILNNYVIDEKMLKIYNNALEKGAIFDCRCFNIPKEEVCNLIYWRQCDATRNSIQMVAHANFPHKEIQNLSCNEIQNKLLLERGINWNNFSIPCKRGTSCIKKPVVIATEHDDVIREKWKLDCEMPILNNDRNYVNNLL